MHNSIVSKSGQITCKMAKIETIILVKLLLVSATNSLSKRSLLFPQASVLQFTYGVSAPVILPSRSINFSICLQCNYDLPYNLTLLMPKIVMARAKKEVDLGREAFYRYIVAFLNSFGLNGQQCLYRLICEISEYPMHLDHRENLLEKIVHFIFTPSLGLPRNSSEHFVERLLQAEDLGRQDGRCDEKYSQCFLSLAALFTSKYII